MSLTATVTAIVKADHTNPLDLVTPAAPLIHRKVVEIANGAGLGQASELFTDQRTVAGSGNEDLDLSGVLIDGFGAAFTLTKLKGIMISSDVANGGDLTLSAPASNGIVGLFTALGDGIVIKPGGTILLVAPDAAGYAVTAATADLINIANADASAAVYDVVLFGA